MMEDQSGYLTHMLMPVGNIQSKGLPSNGVLGNGQVSPPPLQTEELKATLMQQVEYYFSKDNLATDKYLCKCNVIASNFVARNVQYQPACVHVQKHPTPNLIIHSHVP